MRPERSSTGHVSRRGHVAAWVGVCLALASIGLWGEQATAKDLYERAVALDREARARLEAEPGDEADALRAVGEALGAYRRVVRTYPRSGYCDNALWQGAQLSVQAFTRFGRERDRESALAQIKALLSEYPSSSLIAGARAERTRLERPTSVAQTRLPVLISNVTREALSDGVAVTIHLDGPVAYREELLAGPARVFFDLKNTRTTEALRDAVVRFDGDLVRQVRLGRHPDHVTRIVFDLEGARSYEAKLETDPPRLVVICRAADAPVQAAAPVVAPAVAGAPAAAPRDQAAPSVVQSAATAAEPPTGQPPAGASPTSGGPPPAQPTAAQAAPAQPAPAQPAPAQPAPAQPAPTPPPAGAPQPPSSNLAGGFSIARQLGLGANRIVIDAGHGGHDTGALGAGTTEAKVALDIALRLERLLAKEPGVEVVLTRRTDVFIPLQERGDIANREAADLFVSIHANAHRNRSATGVETYLLNFATSSDAAAVAARENSSSEMTMSRLDDLVKKIALGNKVNESRDLARYVQSSLVKRLRPANQGLRDLGVKQAPFVVLVGAAMPSILVEVSFISNRHEGKLLATPSYRQRIAEGILEGIRRYQTSLKKVKVADGSGAGGVR